MSRTENTTFHVPNNEDDSVGLEAQSPKTKVKSDGGQTTTNTNTHPTNAKLSKTKSEEILDTATANIEDHLLKEFAFARFIVRCPCLLCCLILVVLFILTAICSALIGLSFQNLRTNFPDPADEYVDDFDGYSLAVEFVHYDEEEQTNTITQSEDIGAFSYSFVFELDHYKNDLDIDNPQNTDYWVLTPQNIKTIIEYEDKVYKDKEWQDRFCWVGEDPMNTNYTCEFAITSPARMIAEFYDYDYESFTTEDAKNYSMSSLKDYYYCFNPGFIETGQSWIYRSVFKGGAPIGNGQVSYDNGKRIHETDYENAEDALYDQTGQSAEFYEWGFQLYMDIIVNADASITEDELKIQVYSPIIHGFYGLAALTNSGFFLFCAVLVVWAYMCYHLKSIFLASGAMFGILMSFPSAFFVYRVIFQIPIFDGLSMLIVFVLLGVGADDVFVFTDAWTQSELFVANCDIETEETRNCCGCNAGDEQKNIKRMSFTFRRAALAMLVTQITTFFAFLATGMSTLVNMSAFGIWASCVVMMDYFLVITLYPAVLMLHHKYIKKYERACLCCCCRLCCKTNKKPSSPPRQLSRQLSVQEVAAEYGRLEKFLGTKWSVFIIRFKYFILAFFFVLFVLTTVGTLSLKTASTVDKPFADDHWHVMSQNSLQKFSASETDTLVPCHITFGIAGVDREGVRKYRPDDFYGEVIWDDNFEMHTVEQQRYLKFMCESLKNQTDLVHSTDSVHCPIEHFESYLTDESSYSFPLNTENDLTQSEVFSSEWNKFLVSDYGVLTMRDALSYNEHNQDSDTYSIKFYAMWYYTPLVSDVFDGPAYESYLDSLQSWISDMNEDCPNNLCDSVGVSGLTWVWLTIIKGYVSSAVQGILIALPLAFIVMIFSTRNWIIAVFALLDIVGVMLSELSIMYALGYEFALTESISIVVIIGFSVDYVVHLANAYLESLSENRNERLSFSLLTIGISVVSGAVTTFLAGMFLSFAEMIFFRKMGIILMTTVFMSIFWAMCFFTALCAAFGPQNETGDLQKYFKMFWSKCVKRGSESESKPTEVNDGQVQMTVPP